MQRNRGLDIFKGLAMGLVVLNHAVLWPMRDGDLVSAFAYGIAFGGAGVFVAITGYLYGARGAGPRSSDATASSASTLKRRAPQLITPWLFWVPLYAAAPLLWRAVGGGELPIAADPLSWALTILLGGGPLWFLPVLFVATSIVVWLDRRVASWWPAIVGIAVFAALAVGAGILGESPLSLFGGTFWAVLPLFVTGLWYGMRCARAEAAGAPYWARVPGWAAATVMLASMACGGAATVMRSLHPAALWLGWVPYAMALVGGVAALPLAVRLGARYGGGREPGRAAGALALVGQASLGVYVLHPLVMGPLALLAHGRGGVLVGVGIVVATLAIETPLVRWARGVRFLRRIV